MKRIKTLLIALLCLISALPLGGCGGNKRYEEQLFAMDTAMTLTAYGKNAEAGLSSAAGVLRSLDATLDPENEDSAVYAINHANGGSVVVKGQVAEMLSAAAEVYERSNKALDLSIYPLVKAWGFIDGKYTVPSAEEIEALRGNLNFSAVTVTSFTESGDYLVTAPAETALTFGAVARGCASGYAVAALRASGVTSAIVSLGGNVQTLGLKPYGSNWNVAIEDPNDTSQYAGVLSVGETAVITSGSYQRYFEKDGKTYPHILDPHTGYPADSGLKSVTIVCTSGVTADCLSTALFVLGKDAALDYWRTYGGFEMILITQDDQIVCTSGLKSIFTLSNNSYSVAFTD